MGAGIDFVLEAVGRSTLLFLDIGGNEISTKKLNYFSQQLFQNNQLIDLNISKNIFKDMKMFASLLMIWNIQFLNLSSNQLTGKILDPLCEALKKHQTLEKLNLSYNDLSSFPCIVKLIHSNRSIRILILQSCNVGEVSAEFIGEGLEKNRTLEQLDLSGNPMGFFGIEKLSKGLQSNEGLNILNLAKLLKFKKF
jgi:Ran GTPase-activating protein (RanGAP) involved in mRNA processing and transport